MVARVTSNPSMCGISGYLSSSPENDADLRVNAQRMCDAIAHRGPDGEGVWTDATAGVALGHRRLAIVDLSPAGAQPMSSACDRYVMVYNGEIYNHLQLRDRLTGFSWHGHSDTETLLAMFTKHGVLATLQQLVGMFAIALWDRLEQCLVLVRDRMGEKPLYWGRLPTGDLVFGSELKALRAHPRWQAEVDRNALALYMRHSTVPAPHSIYVGINKLEPGCWVRVRANGHTEHGCYWDLGEVVQRSRASAPGWSDVDATDRLEQLLINTVDGQMLADVPLGAFLSGGVDSSTIVALMARRSPQRVRTFAIGFSEAGFDEAAHASAVARHLGTDHTELYVTAADALNVIPQLPTMYDEPFADSSQVPTALVAAMARRHVTVALSGDGGDELFAGYNRYFLAERVWRSLSSVPLPARKMASRAMLAVSPGSWTALGRLAGRVVPSIARQRQLGENLHKFANGVLPMHNEAAMYRALVSHWQDPTSLVLGSQEPRTHLDDACFDPKNMSSVEQMSLLDQLTYLPDDILVKVDRAAMAVGLETRVPLLDHRIVEFAWQLPMHQKIRNGRTKWLLREVLYRHVPPHLIERPKQGFSIPLQEWLRGPLRDWGEALLAPERLEREGFFSVRLVRETWRTHQQGGRNFHNLLWNILMFQSWLEATERK